MVTPHTTTSFQFFFTIFLIFAFVLNERSLSLKLKCYGICYYYYFSEKSAGNILGNISMLRCKQTECIPREAKNNNKNNFDFLFLSIKVRF